MAISIKKYLILLLFLFSPISFGAIIFQDDFESDSSNWKCTDGQLSKWTDGYMYCGQHYNPGDGAADWRMGPGHNSNNAVYAWKHVSVPNDYYTESEKRLDPEGYTRKDIYHRWYMRIPTTFDKATGEGFKYWRYVNAPTGINVAAIYLNNCGDTFRTGSMCILETGQGLRLDLIPTTEIADGNWHSHEVRIKYNTNGSTSDGILQYWFDGTLRHTTNNIRWDTTNVALNWVAVGIGNVSVSPWYMSEWTAAAFDDVIVSDTYNGPIGGGGDTESPTVPTNLSATTISNSQINLSWTASTDNVGVTGYLIERCQGAGCSNFSQIGTPTGTTYNDTGLSASTSYSYRVRAIDAVPNYSGYSSTATAITQAASVPTVSISASPSLIANGSSSTLTWSSTNATSCSASGSWIGAKSTSGSQSVSPISTSTYTLTCTGTGGSANQSAVIIVTGTSVITFFQENFEDTNFGARGWYDGSTGTITATEHIPGSNYSLLVYFPQGTTIPNPDVPKRHLFTESDSAYISYWIKYSTNWQDPEIGFHHEFYLLTNKDNAYSGLAWTHLTGYIEMGSGYPDLSLQDSANINTSYINVDLTNTTENRAIAGCNGPVGGCYQSGGYWFNGVRFPTSEVYFSDSPGPRYKNDWHHVEAYFQMNSISNGRGVADGIMRYWYDGQLIIEHTNIIMRTYQNYDMKFNQFIIAPLIGGAPANQTFWVDNLSVASGRYNILKPTNIRIIYE